MKIVVLQNHTHAGVMYPAGSIVDLPDDDAKWLLDTEQARREAIVQADKRRREVMDEADGNDRR